MKLTFLLPLYLIDAHPIHLHLVFFEVVDRYQVTWDTATTEEDRVIDITAGAQPDGNGTYLIPQPVVQHNGAIGEGFRVGNPTKGPKIDTPFWYFENGPKDTVMVRDTVVARFVLAGR